MYHRGFVFPAYKHYKSLVIQVDDPIYGTSLNDQLFTEPGILPKDLTNNRDGMPESPHRVWGFRYPPVVGTGMTEVIL